MAVYDAVIKKFDELIEEGKRLFSIATPEVNRYQIPSYATMKGAGGYKEEYTGRTLLKSPKEVGKFATDALFLLKEYAGGEKSVFFSEFYNRWGKITLENPIEREEIQGLVGILESARGMAVEGLLSLEAQIASEIYEDILSQADDYFKNKDYLRAAILEGAALEQGLKKIAKLRKVTLSGKKSVLIAHDLVKAKIITEFEKKKIEQWNEIHNKAEHEPDVFKRMLKSNRKEIEQMPEEVKTFLKRYLT